MLGVVLTKTDGAAIGSAWATDAESTDNEAVDMNMADHVRRTNPLTKLPLRHEKFGFESMKVIVLWTLGRSSLFRPGSGLTFVP
jgi:hypothetical protein